jgi:hypothetical protein
MLKGVEQIHHVNGAESGQRRDAKAKISAAMKARWAKVKAEKK